MDEQERSPLSWSKCYFVILIPNMIHCSSDKLSCNISSLIFCHSLIKLCSMYHLYNFKLKKKIFKSVVGDLSCKKDNNHSICIVTWFFLFIGCSIFCKPCMTCWLWQIWLTVVSLQSCFLGFIFGIHFCSLFIKCPRTLAFFQLSRVIISFLHLN